jgi:hypothetical protein
MDPKDGALSALNYARNSPIVGTDFNSSVAGNATVAGFPADNVTDPNREKKWKVAGFTNAGDQNVDKPWAQVTIDCERDINPGMVAIIGSNISQGTIRLYGADDSAMTENVIAYDIDLYDAPNSGVIVGYPNQRRVRVVDPEELNRYANASLTAISSSYDTLGNNVYHYSDLCRLNPGYHVLTGSDFSADDIEYIPQLGRMTQYRSREGTPNPESFWYSYLYWPSADGGSGHWVNTRYKSWPGSGRSATGLPGYSVPLAMPAQFLGYKNTQWVTDPSANVVESTTAQHGYVSSTRADGNASSVLGASDNSSWKASTSRTVVEQTFRLREVYDSGRWALVGWATASSNNTGLEYVKHGSDPDLSYFNLRVWPVDEDASDTAQFIVPESKILDGNFHTISVAYRGVAAASTYGIILDGEYITNTMISTPVDDTSNPYLTYTVGYWNNGGALSDVVDLAGAVVSVSGGGWADGNNEAWAAAQNLDLQARLRYGIGTGADDLKRSFWAVDFDGVNNYGFDGDTLEIGTIWIGDRHDFSAIDSSNIGELSRNTSGVSYGGSVFSTVRNSCRTASIQVDALTKASALALNDALGGSNSVVMDVLAGTDSDADKDAGAIYGVVSQQPSQSVNYNSVSIKWQVKESL